MIVDQLFTTKIIREGEVYDLDREYGAPAPRNKPRAHGETIPRGHPEGEIDFMSPVERAFRKEEERIRQAWAADRAKKGVAEADMGEARVGNRMSDIQIGSPKIVYYKGKAVGEVGLDHEASPGNGPYYFKHYLTGKDQVGYDTKQEALADLKHIVQQMDESDATGGTGQDSKSWMASIQQQYPTVRFVQARMMGAPIIALVNGKPVAQFDTKTGLTEDQLDEIDWKGWQDKMKSAAKGAKDFTKNVRDTGNAAAGMINAYGGAGKELGKQLVARPTAAAYNATKSGLGKAADVAKGVYGDVKQGTQAVGQAVDTVGTDVGQGLQKVGRGVANVTGGTAGALGAVAGGATTGIGRAGVKGFNAGVQNVGGNAVDRAETNIFTQKSDPVEIKKQIDLKKREIADLETELQTASAGAERQAYAGIDPATGRPYTGDYLRNKFYPSQTTTPAPVPEPSPAPLPRNPAIGMTPTSVTYGPGFGSNYYKQSAKPTQAQRDAYLRSINAPVLPESRIAEILEKPLAEMLNMVETKDDVQQIKKFVDQTFSKYGAVNESALIVRNQIIERVTQAGAQRRREFARKSR